MDAIDFAHGHDHLVIGALDQRRQELERERLREQFAHEQRAAITRTYMVMFGPAVFNPLMAPMVLEWQGNIARSQQDLDRLDTVLRKREEQLGREIARIRERIERTRERGAEYRNN